MALRRRPAGGGVNHLKLRWLKTVVVSVEEKAHVMCQVGIGKASVSEPLMTCRKAEDDIKTGTVKWCRDELGGARVLARRCPAWRRRESDLRNVGKCMATPSLRTFGGNAGECGVREGACRATETVTR
jgi:hypothetical protein